MSQKPTTYGQEVRETVVKSGLTGVAATVLAVTIFSPAGFGGLVGTSVASGFGLDSSGANTDDPYANLPPFPSPLTQDELSNIRSELARTTASLEITRAATEAKIEHIRRIALTPGAVTFAPMPQVAAVSPSLRLTLSEPATFEAPAPTPAPAPVVQAASPAQAMEITATPVSYGGNVDTDTFRDPHLELADLLLAHETF